MTVNNTNFQFNIPRVVGYATNPPRTFGTKSTTAFNP